MDEMKTTARTRSLPLILIAAFTTLAACAPSSADELGAPAEGMTASALAAPPQLQLTLAGLATTYATALDAIGDGDLDTGTQLLRGVFAPEAEAWFEFPPGYEALSFGATGPDGVAQAVAGAFRAFGFVRTQHHVTNVTALRTAPAAAVMTSYITAPHVFADNSVLVITARFRDEVRLRGDRWVIIQRDVAVTSLTKQAAFTPPS
jgi:SnoaL-like domain